MFDCTSYPGSNLGDFSGLSDALNPGGVPVWQQLGFLDKGAWKRAGSPTTGATVTAPAPPKKSPGGGMSIGPPQILPVGGSGSDASTSAPVQPDASGGGLLSGIPSSWLLIGGAVVLLMVLKK